MHADDTSELNSISNAIASFSGGEGKTITDDDVVMFGSFNNEPVASKYTCTRICCPFVKYCGIVVVCNCGFSDDAL